MRKHISTTRRKTSNFVQKINYGPTTASIRGWLDTVLDREARRAESLSLSGKFVLLQVYKQNLFRESGENMGFLETFINDRFY